MMLEIRDVLAGMAICISVYTYYKTTKQKESENERNVKEKLVDTMTKLVALDIEKAKLELSIDRDINLTRILNNQRSFLVSQILYLAPKVEELVSDSEYVIIAMNLASIGDFDNAELYWEKSIKASPTKLAMIYNLRGFANFLYKNKSYELGRRKYQEAVDANPRETDRALYDLADTYIMWGRLEKEYGFESEAEKCFDLAKRWLTKIESEGQKKRIIDYLESIAG
ncbi:hypothetical protein [Bacillus paramycoides]|uniref:tetratricopeptide repeat protein n=1 Tax=Bacillus paramycoides TaxID=2026194 RepID=UPI002E1EA27E|nr:hypothetical protein [Bacillus paramycoides]